MQGPIGRASCCLICGESLTSREAYDAHVCPGPVFRLDAADYSWDSRGVFSSAYKAMLDGAAMFPPIIYDDRSLTRWEWVKVHVFRKPDPRHFWPNTIKVTLNTDSAPIVGTGTASNLTITATGNFTVTHDQEKEEQS